MPYSAHGASGPNRTGIGGVRNRCLAFGLRKHNIAFLTVSAETELSPTVRRPGGHLVLPYGFEPSSSDYKSDALTVVLREYKKQKHSRISPCYSTPRHTFCVATPHPRSL